jgi:hypothetical protein
VSSSLFGSIPHESGDEHTTANGVVDPPVTRLDTVERLYDPGPSFSEDERPVERLSLMPAWLQTFAASVGEPEDDAAGAPLPAVETVAAPVSTVPAPEDAVAELPTWLAEERPAPDGDAGAAPALVTPVAAALISEDDLPEWLRAIAPADVDEGVASGGGVTAITGGPRSVLAAPSVGRAWLQGHDLPALSEGATVFALMARESIATALPAPEDDPAPAGAASDAAGLLAADASGTQSESLTVPVRADATAPTATQPRPRWMIYALALLLIILVLIALRLVI